MYTFDRKLPNTGIGRGDRAHQEGARRSGLWRAHGNRCQEDHEGEDRRRRRRLRDPRRLQPEDGVRGAEARAAGRRDASLQRDRARGRRRRRGLGHRPGCLDGGDRQSDAEEGCRNASEACCKRWWKRSERRKLVRLGALRRPRQRCSQEDGNESTRCHDDGGGDRGPRDGHHRRGEAHARSADQRRARRRRRRAPRRNRQRGRPDAPRRADHRAAAVVARARHIAGGKGARLRQGVWPDGRRRHDARTW